MEVPRAIRYITATDILQKSFTQEANVHKKNEQDTSVSLPLDSGIEGAAEIYKIRTLSIAKYTGALMCRVTGIDAAYRIATKTEFPQ